MRVRTTSLAARPNALCPGEDFDPRYGHAAPPDQVLPYFVGGEPVRITGVRPGGDTHGFALPAFRPQVIVRVGEVREALAVRCDSLVIDTEASRFWLVARGSTNVHGRLANLRWIKVQGAPGG